MTTLREFVKDKDFGGDTTSFPAGETILNLDDTTIEETIVNFAGEDKTRYIISTGGKRLWAGVRILKGIKDAESNGARKVKVIRQGSGKETTYVVLPVEAKQ